MLYVKNPHIQYFVPVAALRRIKMDKNLQKLTDIARGTYTSTNDEFDDLMRKELEKISSATNDNVNHPKHYCRENGMESIDEMVLVFGVEAVKNFCLCNVWKYRYRAADKNGEEDLKKSDWYMRKYKELCDEQKKNLTQALNRPCDISVIPLSKND